MTVSWKTLVGVALVIVAATVWLYWPSVHGGFLTGMDDDEYLRQAARCNGLTWNAVKWAFTTTQPYYQPLPRLSHALDYQMWRKNAAGHHATSVVVHALNVALVFGFAWALLGAVSLTTGERLAMALGVAVVFAIHPLQVESVAWMSGRTQLLGTTFGIGCVWAYVAGARRWAVWGLFVASLLCKPMAVLLPFVMLAIDYFPLRRYEQLGWGRLLREKAVLIGLGVAATVAALIAESRKGGLMIPLEKAPLWERVLLMFQSLVFYPWKLVWPGRLSPVYPLRLGVSLGQPLAFASTVCVAIVAVLSVRDRRRMPVLGVSWAAYVMLVLPLSGLVHAGIAPRHAYLAMLPLLLLGGGAAVSAWRHSATVARVGLVGVLACALCVFGLLTRRLIPVWHDDETLWRTVLSRFPDSSAANRSLVRLLLDQGRSGEALDYAQRWVELMPELEDAHFDLGSVLVRLGRLQDAVEEYEEAVRINPNDVEAYVNLGSTFLQMGGVQAAIEQYEQALRINPDSAAAHGNLGAIYQHMGKLPEAVEQYQHALRSEPDYVEAHYNLGLALEKLGRAPEAIAEYQQALKLQPDFAPAKSALTQLQAGQ